MLLLEVDIVAVGDAYFGPLQHYLVRDAFLALRVQQELNADLLEESFDADVAQRMRQLDHIKLLLDHERAIRRVR